VQPPARLGGAQDGTTDPIVERRANDALPVALTQLSVPSSSLAACPNVRHTKTGSGSDVSASKGFDDPEDVGDVLVEPAQRRYRRAATGEQDRRSG